jgi:hypothetical protein
MPMPVSVVTQVSVVPWTTSRRRGSRAYTPAERQSTNQQLTASGCKHTGVAFGLGEHVGVGIKQPQANILDKKENNHSSCPSYSMFPPCCKPTCCMTQFVLQPLHQSPVACHPPATKRLAAT